MEGKKSGSLVDVGRWMGVIRRRARLVVVAEELRALEGELAGSRVERRVLERVRGLRELVRDL